MGQLVLFPERQAWRRKWDETKYSHVCRSLMEKRNVPFDAAEDGRRQGEEERPGETGESTPGGGGLKLVDVHCKCEIL